MNNENLNTTLGKGEMQEYYLDVHSKKCASCNPDPNNPFDYYCQVNPKRFLFYLKGNFIIITYHYCMENYDEYSFKKDLINQIIENNSVYERWEVNKGVDVRKELLDFRIRNQALRNFIQEVNFLYEDMCHKEYAITTTIEYAEAILDRERIDRNFQNALSFLEKNEYKSLIKRLKDLYIANLLPNQHYASNHKSREHLIKTIKEKNK